jgi:hypothetical protein
MSDLEWHEMKNGDLQADDEMWIISPRSNSGRFNLTTNDVLECGTVAECQAMAQKLENVLNP